MCPTTITASLEESEDVTTACQVVHENVALLSTAVRLQTIYQRDDISGGGEWRYAKSADPCFLFAKSVDLPIFLFKSKTAATSENRRVRV